MSDPKAYQYDFDGKCAPDRPGYSPGWTTFSLGIFQWLPKSGGRGLRGELKRGKVIQRVKGLTSDPEAARQKAREIVERLNQRQFGVGQP